MSGPIVALCCVAALAGAPRPGADTYLARQACPVFLSRPSVQAVRTANLAGKPLKQARLTKDTPVVVLSEAPDDKVKGFRWAHVMVAGGGRAGVKGWLDASLIAPEPGSGEKDAYIAEVRVDLAAQAFTLVWEGRDRAKQKKGPFRCSTGGGVNEKTGKSHNCDDVTVSRTPETNCTPKGTWAVFAKQPSWVSSPEAKFVVRFAEPRSRKVALHYYPKVPSYPASHGCVRVADAEVAALLYRKTVVGKTKVVVAGKWTRKAGK